MFDKSSSGGGGSDLGKQVTIPFTLVTTAFRSNINFLSPNFIRNSGWMTIYKKRLIALKKYDQKKRDADPYKSTAIFKTEEEVWLVLQI